MSQTGQRGNRTDDLSWAMGAAPDTRCWICRRPGATETRILGSSIPDGGTKVPYCAEGIGCRDGRIYHGPLANPHWPGDPCDYCKEHGEPDSSRRMAGNRARLSTRAANRGQWHR